MNRPIHSLIAPQGIRSVYTLFPCAWNSQTASQSPAVQDSYSARETDPAHLPHLNLWSIMKTDRQR